ncbi:hypothetical protein MKEN_01136800 [Mycena kentingensis (nom. inval.)]|nr:hypothetical protein MKEN_01136800 [Mycena kentingensis (nom. inval.)]
MQPQPPSKRRKTAVESSNTTQRKQLFVTQLPFELVAEVLLYTTSKDVLAVARTCKFLSRTLVRPEAIYIWRYTRENGVHPSPLPDPSTIGMSEPAFAAYVYDSGTCANCGKTTTNMYSSFSLRIRFCSRPECPADWTPKHAVRVTNSAILKTNESAALEWLSLAESPACFRFPKVFGNFGADTNIMRWPEADKVYLKASMSAARAEFAIETADKVRKRHANEKALQADRMKFFVKLYEWRFNRTLLERQVRKANDVFSQSFAKESGYDYQELIYASKTFNSIRLHKTRLIEKLVKQDFSILSDSIEAEIIIYRDRQVRRTREASIRSNRAQVEAHYNRLLTHARSQHPPLALPSLAEFRTLPILGLLQSGEAPKSTATASRGAAFHPRKKATAPTIARDLQCTNTLVSTMLDTELEKWRADAQAKLGVALGFPADWKTAKNNVLHPVHRFTARWMCSKCNKVERRNKWEGCLDFEDACRHECPGSRESKQKPRNKSTWEAGNFVQDNQAVGAMTRLLSLCEIDAESSESTAKLEAVGTRVLCRSCPGAIVMPPSNVVGHSHRHAEMEMELLEPDEAEKIFATTAPFDVGRAKYLLSGTEDHKVKNAKENWTFGCRHCDQERVLEPPPPAEDVAEEKEVERSVRGELPKKQRKTFKFNGLRSHLAEKHKVELVCDEDFYRVD